MHSYTISLRNVTGVFFFTMEPEHWILLHQIYYTFNILYIQTMIFCIYNLAITCFVFPGQHILFCIIKPLMFSNSRHPILLYICCTCIFVLRFQATTELSIQPPQLEFLLEDFTRKLSHALISSTSKRKSFLKVRF